MSEVCTIRAGTVRSAAAALLSVVATAVAGSPVPADAGPGAAGADLAPMVLAVDVARPFKAVDHAASGSLYGIGDEGWPADRWVSAIRPAMFTQPPPGATHRPNGEPEPAGDTLDVWQAARRNGAQVTIRLPDIFPTFPYQWQGDDFWYSNVEAIVRATMAAGVDNVYGYEIWNEPQWTWNPSWGDYDEMWTRTYRLIRTLDPDTPIIGPSHDRDFENGMWRFLTAAVATDTVPDIVSWHELDTATALDVEVHVERYREIENELGIGPLPISINEYGSPRDAGVPGWLARFVARLERAEVDTANLAFWHKPGRLADLLTPVGGGSGPARQAEPTGNFWLYEWYGGLTGNMVHTTPPSRVGRTIPVGEPRPAPSTRTAGRDGFGTAIGLNGTEPNRYVELPRGVLRGLTDFTIASWVNVPAEPATWSRIFDFGTSTQVTMFLTPRSGDAAAGNAVRFSITDNGGGAEQRIDGTAPLSAGWTHVAVTRSGTTGTLYVNGEPVGVNANLTLSPADLAGGDTTNNWIGRSQFPDPLLGGAVDDFEIHDRALTPAQLRSLMTTPGGDVGGGNVAWYRFDEPAGATAVDSSGNGRDGQVVTRIDGVEHLPALDGFAAADPRTGTVRVVFGGGRGDIQLRVDGLPRRFGRTADVQVFTTEWTGTDGVSAGPVALLDGDYPVRDGSISVPVSGIRDSDAYLAVVTPARDAPDFPGPVRRHEAEAAIHGSDHRWAATADSPLASGNRYVRPRRSGELTFTVDAPVAGAYDLGIRYTNPSGAPGRGDLVVNGTRRTLEYQPTAAAAFATNPTHVVLNQGRNRLTIGLRPDAVGVDHIDVTPFRARFEAESGQWSGADLVTIDMAENNFFANYVSADSYVRGLAQPTSNLRLPVTVPAAGSYVLRIGYSTAGTEQERRAQLKAGHLVRVDDGPWGLVDYEPTQFRELIRQTTVVVDLPAGRSTITLAKGHPDHPGGVRPGVVDLDYVDVELVSR